VNPYLIAAIGTVIAAVFKIHVAVNAAGVFTFTVWVPAAIAVTLALVIAVLLCLIVRNLAGGIVIRSRA
jgi:uncharacterized protein (DUF983 family)